MSNSMKVQLLRHKLIDAGRTCIEERKKHGEGSRAHRIALATVSNITDELMHADPSLYSERAIKERWKDKP